MSTEKELSVIRFKREGVCDVSAEVTLEDYRTDVKRILSCRETVLSPSKYISKGEIELEGSVCYRIIYLGTDNRLYGVEHSEDYSIVCKADGESTANGVRDITAVWSEGVSARLLSPRKFAIRNRICSKSAVTGTAEKEDCVTERFVPSSCESMTKQITAYDSISLGGEVIELCDEYIPRSDGERIISADCSLFVSDVHAEDGRLVVRGELTVDILACNDEGFELPYTVRRKLPFTQETEHIDITKGAKVNASGFCTGLKVVPEDARVLITAYCTLEYTLSYANEEFVCTDAFSPTSKLKLTEGRLGYFGTVLPQNGNLSISASPQLSELGVAPTRTAIVATGGAYVTDLAVNRDNGKGTIIGECRFSAVFGDDSGESVEFEAKDIIVPFRYEFPFDICGEPSLYCQSPTLSRISLRSDGEKAAVDCELALSFVAVCECEEGVITDISIGEALERDASSVRILYPQSGETLWSLAKSTSTRVCKLCETNGIQYDSRTSKVQTLDGRRFIII